MNIIRINPTFVKQISLDTVEFLLNRYINISLDKTVEEITKTPEIFIIECESSDIETNGKNIILPQFEIGNFKVAEIFLIKILSMENLGASIIGEDEENIYVSLIELQEIANDYILNICNENGFIEAEIINFVKFGAYLIVNVSQENNEKTLNCFKTYLLKNSDFSIDHTPISKVKKEGDKIKIKIYNKDNIENTKLTVEAYEKYENPNKVDVNNFSNVSIAIGHVSSINSTMTFVNLADGVDALTNISPNCQNIRVGSKVVVSKLKITEKEGNLKISGLISNIINY